LRSLGISLFYLQTIIFIEMKTIFKLFVLLILVTTIEPGCSKYPDGPKLSLRTRKARLINDWKSEMILANGVDITATQPVYFLNLKKDGSYTFQADSITDEGTWELGGDKDDAYLKSKTGVETANRLLRLKHKELWVRITVSNGNSTVIHYIPK
jgi:hypothetical protein